MRVAVVENTAITHHGQVGVALHEAAARVDVFRPFQNGLLPQRTTDYDALIVFGGEQSARDDVLHPYLPELVRTMRRFGEEGRAVLGICLGSQLLARAYGATNYLGSAPEFGWQPVHRTEAGQVDPVLAALPDQFPVFQWHRDTFSVPEGAVHLAYGPNVPAQAFRVGRASYGMQFHFEASRAVVADWLREFPHLAEAMSPGWTESHAALAEAHGPQADSVGLTIARAFVAGI